MTSPVLGDGTATFTPGVSERRGSTTTYSHSGLKNVEARTGSGQTVTADRQYDAFGLVVNSSGTWNQFGYAGSFGYQEDADHGLKLLGHRYYDPSTGRFLTRDPVKDGRNWYGYCESNPVSCVDFDGLKTWKVYKLFDEFMNFLKWGVTGNDVPTRRYGGAPFWERTGWKMEIEKEYEVKGDAFGEEYHNVCVDPGPMNKEPWAGSGIFGGLIISLKAVVDVLDPTPFGLAQGAAETAAQYVTPYVEERKRAREEKLRWWLEE